MSKRKANVTCPLCGKKVNGLNRHKETFHGEDRSVTEFQPYIKKPKDSGRPKLVVPKGARKGTNWKKVK